ncbi:potassium/proton antiporter [Egibacter rhizosphaerae]|uniref:Potassium/proton antiporter n=1 Tax=Egibacter rhizosphaerae TaxID=1670831 RepID=A0A411YLK8_9ACTN|nr:potassium/proton antiporter [Egibacter rhizosphaerae]
MDPLVLGAGVLVVLGVLTAALAERIRMPALLLFLGLGMLVGDDGLGLTSLDDPEVAQTAGVLALLVILFEGGLTTRASDLRRAAAPGFLMATLGVVLTAGTVAAGVLLLTDLEVTTALLLGAVVSSTDAAAVFTVVRRSPLPRRITSLLEVESGANDPMAVLLTVSVLEAWRLDPAPADLVVFGLTQLGGGAFAGLVVGGVAVQLLRRAPLGAATLYAIFALGAAGAAYGLAAWFGASGFLAVYVCGLLVGLYVPRHRRTIRAFHQALAGLAEIGLFLLLGLLVFPSELPGVTLPAIGITAVLVVLARPLAVHVCMGWYLLTRRWHPRELALVSWAGLRGAVPIVLATFPLTQAYPQGAFIFNTIFFVVLVSTALQGSSIGGFARLLGLREEVTVWAPIAEFLPVDDPDLDVIEVEVADDMPIADATIRQRPLPDGFRVVAIVREGRTLVPRGDTTMHPGDRIVITTATDPSNNDRIVSWATGQPA